MVELKFLRIDPDTGNLMYKGDDGNVYMEIQGVIHDLTDEGEPNTPVRDAKVKAGEPVYDPNDRFARKLEQKLKAEGKLKESNMKNIKTFEAFNWEDHDNTDLSGMGWESKCRALIAEFCFNMEKEMPVGTAATIDRKDALKALGVLFNQALTEARGHADVEFCGTEQPDDADWKK